MLRCGGSEARRVIADTLQPGITPRACGFDHLCTASIDEAIAWLKHHGILQDRFRVPVHGRTTDTRNGGLASGQRGRRIQLASQRRVILPAGQKDSAAKFLYGLPCPSHHFPCQAWREAPSSLKTTSGATSACPNRTSPTASRLHHFTTWQRNGGGANFPLIVAAANPRSVVICQFAGWPNADGACKPDLASEAALYAIEAEVRAHG
jgi:hypothetical protein